MNSNIIFYLKSEDHLFVFIGKPKNKVLITINIYPSVPRMLGANFLAYPPVVGTGNNANPIHYIAATDCVNPGDLILIDAGPALCTKQNIPTQI